MTDITKRIRDAEDLQGAVVEALARYFETHLDEPWNVVPDKSIEMLPQDEGCLVAIGNHEFEIVIHRKF